MNDPRTDRTREHVLSCTSRLLAREGVGAVTFSRVSQESRVSRSTLYRHWQSRDDLICAAALPGFSTGALGAQTGLRQFLLNYLVQTSAGLTAPATLGLFAKALHTAQTDDVVRLNFQLVAASFQRVVEERFGPMDSWDHACLVGPVFFHALMMYESTDDQLLDHWVQDILSMPRRERPRGPGPHLPETGTG